MSSAARSGPVLPEGPLQESWKRALREARREFVDELGLRRGHRVLALCAGTGPEAIAVARRVGEEGEVVAVDLNAEHLALAKRRAALESVRNVTTLVGDVTLLPPELTGFDRITCVFAIHLLPSRRELVGYWRERLRPGGALGLADWLESGPAEVMLGIKNVLRDFVPSNDISLVLEPWLTRSARDDDFGPELWADVRERTLSYPLPYSSVEEFWTLQRETPAWQAIRRRLGPRFRELDRCVRAHVGALAEGAFEQELRVRLVVALRRDDDA